MMDVKQLYADLMREIEEDARALEKKRELAELLRERLGVSKEVAMLLPSSERVMVTSRPRATFVHTYSRPTTFNQTVRNAIGRLKQPDFTVNDVHDYLVQVGMEMPEQPKTKIATILGRMAERGELSQTFKGSGNVPNRYRSTGLRTSQSEDANDDGTSDLV